MQRIKIDETGLFISRPGFDVNNGNVARLVDPRFQLLSEHARGEALSNFSEGSGAGGWSRHRAQFNFPTLPFVPIVQWGLQRVSSNVVTYPEFIISDTTANSNEPGDKMRVGTNYVWAESAINQYTTAGGLFRLRVTVYNADSGLEP